MSDYVNVPLAPPHHMQWVLRFDRTIRIGLDLFGIVGPFETDTQARRWWQANAPDESVTLDIIRIPTLGERVEIE